MKVSDNVGTDESEPEVLFDGLHHGDEHMSQEMTLAILSWLTTGYGSDSRITSLVNSREICIVFGHEPGRRDVRHRAAGRTTTGARTCQPTPGSSVRRDGPQPQLRLPLGLLRRVEQQPRELALPRTVAVLGAGDAGVPRLRRQPRRRRPAADPDRDQLPHDAAAS